MTFLREVGCVPRVCMDPAAGLSANPWPLFHGQEAAGGRLCLCPGQPPKTCPVGGLLPHMWVQDSGGGAQDPCVDRSAGPRLQGASAEDAGVLTAPTAPAQPDSGWGGGGSPPVLSPSG